MPAAALEPPAVRPPPTRRVVLLHGFAQTGGCWGHVPAELRALGYEVRSPDLPGHGDGPRDAMDLPETARWASGWAEGAAGGRATFVGYSFGGRVCLRLALDHPAAVERLVLVSATPGLEDGAERSQRRAADEALADGLEANGVDAFLDRWLAQPLFAGLSPAAQHRTERRRNTAAGLAGSLRRAGTGAQGPMWDRLTDLEGLPVLLVTGSDDRKFGAIAERVAAAIGPSATHVVVDRAGHTVHLERPDAFRLVVSSWLGRAGAGEPRPPAHQG